MKALNSISLIILFFGIRICTFSQSYNYKHYTVEDGLPSSEVYSAFQDSKGYMWFATDAGVSRFNGYEFKNYDSKDGLTDNTVFLITEDSKGRIWFGTFNNQLCYYFNDSIYPYKYNKKLKNATNQTNVLNNFYVDSLQTIWLGYSTGGGIVSCDKNGIITQHISSRNDYSFTLKIHQVNNKLIWGGLSSEKSSFKITNRIPHVINFFVEIQKDTINKLLRWDYTNSNVLAINIGVISNNKQIRVLINDSIYYFDSNKKLFKRIKFNGLENTRLFSYHVEDDNVWICTEKNGVIIYDDLTNDFKKSQVIFEDKKIARVYKDKEGGRWFCSLNEGIFYLKTSNFSNISFKNNSIKSLEIDTCSNNLFIGIDNGQIFKLSKVDNEYKTTSIYKSELFSEILKFNYMDSSLILGFSNNKLAVFKNEKIEYRTNIKNLNSKSILIDSNIIYRVNDGVSKIVDNKEVYYSASEGKKYWCTSLVKDKKNIWIGTNQGLVCFDDNTYKISKPFRNHKLLSTAITCLEKLNNNIILVGTKSFGLLLMQNQKIIAVINEKNGLVSNLIKSLHVGNQNEIWIGSIKGLSRLNYISPEKYTVQNITTHHGLISNEISYIRSYKNTIFLVTPKNLIEFDKTKLIINKTPSPIYITKIEVNDVEKDLKKNPSIELSYDENRIDIHFESLNYKSLGEINYKYRLLDIDTSWQNTTQTAVSFYALPPDNYTFEVKAQNEDRFWSKPATYSFKINPPFWLTWWFIGFEVVFIILVLMIIFKYRETQLLIKSKNLQRIAENEKKIMELELRALKSQMNPHFIFNTLNSIQHFISSNNFKDSNRYITNFSKLIRMVLNQSDKSYITLREETEMLNLYLSLEQVRFSNEFEFIINLDDNIDLDFDKIPPMLLQPFVENAIWHGLMNKNEKGQIEIKFSIDGDYLLCTVKDNGIGRVAAEEIKATRKIQNKSVGMTITKERLNIINSEMYENMNVEVIDLYNKNNLPTGTTVKIKIALT